MAAKILLVSLLLGSASKLAELIEIKATQNSELPLKENRRHVSKKEVAAPSPPQSLPVEISYKDYAVRPALNDPFKTVDLQTLAAENPLLAALLLSYSLGIAPKSSGFNHPEHLPTNPYVALLLSHYGKYVPVRGRARGIYGYTAANNYHNNLPFGAYKIYEDSDS